MPQVARFGIFEVDFQARELHKRGLKIRLQEQPFQVLAALLEHPGQVVTREQLRRRIWPADTFVDFDNGLNGAINRLRDALGDSADSPRFVETVPRRGYRFIAPVEDAAPIVAAALPGNGPQAASAARPAAEALEVAKPRIRRQTLRGLALAGAVSLALLLALNLPRLRQLVHGTTRIHAMQAQQQMSLASVRTINPEAYQYYLKGRYNFMERWSPDGDNNALRYFQMAIEKDSNYAPAYAGLAYCQISARQELPPHEAWFRAVAAARKALELDDRLSEAHIAMADVLFRLDWNWPQAEQEFKRGLELGPNDAFGHVEYSLFLGIMGRPDEAITQATRARELDPFSPLVSNGMSWVYTFARKPDEAIAEARRTLQLDPDFIQAHGVLAWSYEEKGMYARAVSEELQVRALRADSPEQIESLRKAFATSGIRGFWEKSLQWEKRQLNQPRPPYMAMARACVRLGRKDEAFHWLEKAYDARYPFMPNINIVAWADPIRSDPRFADLMRRLGLPP